MTRLELKVEMDEVKRARAFALSIPMVPDSASVRRRIYIWSSKKL